MELALNFAWFTLAAVMLVFWHRSAPAHNRSRGMQFVALALALVILLPAISVTDDLLAAQHPAEIDTSIRRSHDWLLAHAVSPVVLASFLSLATSFASDAPAYQIALCAEPPAQRTAVIASIDSRPPPRL